MGSHDNWGLTFTSTTLNLPKNVFFIKAFQNIGCYYSSSSCSANDVFTETGLSSTKCSSAIAYLTDMKCWIGRTCGYSYVSSASSMTVDKCLQMCTSNGFKYAGLGT